MEQIKFKIPIWDEPFQDKFEKGTKGKSDPRIGVSIPMRDIITHGERIK